MTKEELFTRGYLGVKTQPRVVLNYHNDEGRCIVGHLLSENEAREFAEDNNPLTLLTRKHLPEDLAPHYPFLCRLQHAHDNDEVCVNEPTSELILRLHDFAKDEKLALPEDFPW